MNPDRARQVQDLFREQSGVVTRQQLARLGVPARTVTRRVAEGQWRAAGNGVLIASGVRLSLEVNSRIAALRVPGAVLTGPSTAAFIPHRAWEGCRLGQLPWLIHRPRSAPARYLRHPGVRVVNVGSLRLASTADALIDAIRLLPPARSRSLAYRALQTRALSMLQFSTAAAELRHHAGGDQLLAILDDLGLGIRSEAERRLVELLRTAGIRGWRCDFEISVGRHDYRLDVAFPDLSLGIEVDGYAYHSARDRFQRDRQRQNALVNAGWTILRFTWSDLTERQQQTVRVVAAAITRLSQRP